MKSGLRLSLLFRKRVMRPAASNGRIRPLSQKTVWSPPNCNRLVATELEKRWNSALARVAQLEKRVEEASALVLHLTAEQRQQLLALGDESRTAVGSSPVSRHVEKAYPAPRPAGSDRRHYG